MSFCKNCGYMFLSENDNMCGNCGTPRGQGSNFCSNCGASITPEQNNCTMCGYFVGKSGTNPNPNPATAYAQNNNTNAGFNQNPYQGAPTTTANPNPLQGTAFDQNRANVNNSFPVNQGNPYANPNAQKSKVAAGLLGIFFGAFGVHNFYLGFSSRAITQLVLSIVGIFTSCIGVGALLLLGMSIWGFVEGIMILTGRIEADANGIPLKE